MSENENHENRRYIVMSEMMTPDMVNFHGNIHGGHVLSFLDRVAYACAARYSCKNVVTLSVDQVVFKEPIYVGELVTCLAAVNYVGTTSMEIGIRVIAENLMTGHARHTNTCYFTMVGVDETGKPAKVPPLTTHNEIQQRRYNEALLRKETRLKIHKNK